MPDDKGLVLSRVVPQVPGLAIPSQLPSEASFGISGCWCGPPLGPQVDRQVACCSLRTLHRPCGARPADWSLAAEERPALDSSGHGLPPPRGMSSKTRQLIVERADLPAAAADRSPPTTNNSNVGRTQQRRAQFVEDPGGEDQYRSSASSGSRPGNSSPWTSRMYCRNSRMTLDCVPSKPEARSKNVDSAGPPPR